MGSVARINWNETRRLCPEFYPGGFDFFWTAIAIYGVASNIILVRKFNAQLNASVFLFALSFADMGYCLLYIYTYFFKSLTMYWESDTAAAIQFRMMGQIKSLEEFGHIFLPILIFLILLERLIWTAPKRVRATCTWITDSHKKMIITSVLVAYSIVGSLSMTWNISDAEHHFCDVLLLPLRSENEYVTLLVEFIVPTISFSVGFVMFFLSLVVLCRVTRVGKELKNSNSADEMELSNLKTAGMTVVFPTITAHTLRRSILAMLLVYFFFFIRGFCYYVFANPRTTSILELNRNGRIMRTWSYDILNLLASATRNLIYWALVGHHMVVDYPLIPKN